MKKSGLILLFILLIAAVSFATEIKIDKDCLYDNDLFYDGVGDKILCGIKPGESKTIHTSLVRKFLSKGYKQPKFNTKDLLVVKRDGQKIDELFIKNKIFELYRQKFPDVDIEIAKITIPNNIYFSKDRGLIFKFMNDDYFGSVYFLLSTYYHEYRIYAYIRGYKEVYVTKSRVSKNEMLTDKVEKKRVEITKIRGFPCEKIDNVVAKKTIPKNRVVTNAYVIQKPDAFKGDYVTVFYKGENVFIKAKGILQENAYRNKYVKIANPSSKKIFFAKYLGGRKAIIIDN
ncbi:hypothetical protein DEFDS_2151 [Deferribacter desulfuricans SSM1]|uniref:Flagella basal body P-ring formation protein FlgA SAF domain-containing protein n=1 Tax=Deferribacter desulfuricans (strain DSM 14783 / JCM 11476 / NBRC 101012 / SSM1) TaxID=639282 RepID=D3PA58_DEFDS|nr:flagellar basal body P-ring formation chaperone FlgA [Deferribacter desulfuricans]BAI81598.1 hypothetical protein DEFDS_2151 [Deferribacter desulfuricans SSM1]